MQVGMRGARETEYNKTDTVTSKDSRQRAENSRNAKGGTKSAKRFKEPKKDGGLEARSAL